MADNGIRHYPERRRCPAPSPRQRVVLAFIANFAGENGYPPTLREIGKATGIGSTNGVNDHLKALARKGLIHRNPMISRGTVVTPEGLAWLAWLSDE